MRHSVPSDPAPFNPESDQLARPSAHLDESTCAEMNVHFAYDRQPTEAEIDAMFEAEMIRRDLEALERSTMSPFALALAEIAADAEAAREESRKRFG